MNTALQPIRSGNAISPRRGLTLIELTLALSITAIVAVAISAALSAVNVGVNSQRDNRTAIVRASAAQSRITAYIGSSRALLGATNNQVVVWLNDSRVSESVHASELRWLRYDPDTAELYVAFVQFPDSWTQTMQELGDREYSKNANWDLVYAEYESRGLLASVTIVDGLQTFDFTLDNVAVQSAGHVNFELGIETETGVVNMVLGATIRHHRPPQR